MITWIPVQQELPKMHKAIDGDGREYQISHMLLLWDGADDRPIAVGCLEDGQWYSDGLLCNKVTHWAYINEPDGHILQQEY